MPATFIAPSEDLLAELRTWVEIETPTHDAARVNRLIDLAHRGLADAGAQIERIPGRDGFGDNLIATAITRSCRDPNAKPILVLSHLDTVWPVGSLQRMPFRIDGDIAYGPGIVDMKAGAFAAFYAMRQILRDDIATNVPIRFLLTPDEEVGSPTSRDIIEREAAGAALVLVTEAAQGDDRSVTARKGVGRFSITVTGVNAHAGAAYEDGASAILELSRQIVRLNDLVDIPNGITLNVAPVSGGTVPNVIADHASCEVDLRVPTIPEGERLESLILGLKPFDPRCKVTVTGGVNRPSWAETPDGLSLYERVRAIGAGVGLTIGKMVRGGGSDGNFTAAMGVPTIDGLGCPGAGAHAPHEQIRWRELHKRTALMAALMEELE